MALHVSAGYKIRSRATIGPPALDGVDLAITGLAIDDRGQAAVNALTAASPEIHTFEFDARNHAIALDGAETRPDRLRSLFLGKRRVILDATTLGIGAVLQLLLSLTRAGIQSVEFLYVEPLKYSRRDEANGHAQQRDYSLSTNCRFSTVHGFAQEYDPSRKAAHVFMLGFEPARMLNAIEQRGYEDQHRTAFHVVFGVPAFQAGWESNSIRPHLAAMEDLNIAEKNVSYCQANSVREGYLALWKLYRDLGDEQSCFYVSPLGTKPHGVAAALFLLETKPSDAPTSLYYDHPHRVAGRSSHIGAWHHVVVNFA
jgi:hypothetical protein